MNRVRATIRLCSCCLILSAVLVLGIIQWSFLPFLVQNGPVYGGSVVEMLAGHTCRHLISSAHRVLRLLEHGWPVRTNQIAVESFSNNFPGSCYPSAADLGLRSSETGVCPGQSYEIPAIQAFSYETLNTRLCSFMREFFGVAMPI